MGKLVSCTEAGEYMHSVLHISRDEEVRTVHHYWYHTWPDHGAPEEVTGVVEMLRDVRSVSKASASGPWVLHCSAGIGRTGTFIAIDMGAWQLAYTGQTDLLSLIRAMREDRGGMVQT